MPYCDVSLVRKVSGLDSSDISDADIKDLRDNVATPELNQDINMRINDERVQEISDEKENNINGTNKTFYLREVHENKLFLGDRDNDGVVDGNDVNAYYHADDDTIVQNLTVTLTDYQTGEVKIEESGGSALKETDVEELYVEYEVCPLDANKPHLMIERACAQLTAAYAFTNIDASKLENFSVGNVTIRKQSEGFDTMYSQYQSTLDKITQTQVVQTEQNENTFKNLDVFHDDR